MRGETQGDRPQRVAVLLVMAVFVLGVALGVLGTYLEGYRVFGAGIMHRQPVDRGPVAQQRHQQAQVDRITKELGLSADQQKQLDGILSQTATRYAAVHEQTVTEMEQVRKQWRDQIRAVLTPEQLPKFEEFLRKIDEERKKRTTGSN